MKQKKIIKIAAITIHALAFILGVSAFSLILFVFTKADLNVISEYIRSQTEFNVPVTYQDFILALQLSGVYSSTIVACCFGLGACVCSLAGNILGIVSNFESKNDRLAS